MEKTKFKEKFPENLQGYTIGKLRISDRGNNPEVYGFVLLDLNGEKRFILYIGDDSYITSYW